STRSGGAASTTRSGSGVTSTSASKALGSAKRALTPAEVQRLTQFAACLRKHGVDVPPPRTSSRGATLDLKGVDTAATSVRKAEARCASKLAGGVRGGGVQLKGVHVKGVHIGGVKAGGVKVGPVHV